jgi:hypothetical protein
MIASGRRAGRAWAHRLAILEQLALEEHAHVAAVDGLWCVTGSPEQVLRIGPLWEKIRQPCPDRRPAGSSLYRELQHRRPDSVIYDEIPRWEWTGDET